MQGILKDFQPLIKDGKHSKWEDNFKFKITLEINGADVLGEGMAQKDTGSPAWVLGKKHEFTKKDNEHAFGGVRFTGLKCTEQNNRGSFSGGGRRGHDMKSESFVIARFAHTFALDWLKNMPEDQAKKIHDEHGNKVIGHLTNMMAENVVKVANKVYALAAEDGQDKEAD